MANLISLMPFIVPSTVFMWLHLMQKFYMPFTTEQVAKQYDYIVGKC